MKICATTGPFKEIELDDILSIFDEIGINYFEGSTDDRKHIYPYIFRNEELNKLRNVLSSHKCKFVVLSGGWADFAVRESLLKFQFNSVIKQLEFCQTFGIKTLRLFVSHLPSKYVEEKYFERVIKNIKKLLPEIKKYNVEIAFENHGGITATLKDILKIIESITDNQIGVNFDPANFVPWGQDPIEALNKLISYIKHCHLKDIVYTNNGKLEGYEFVTLGKGIIDYKKIFNILKRNKYKKYLSIESEVSDNKIKSLIESHIYLKKYL